MSYPDQHDQRPTARVEQPRSAFSGPRLDLPRFQFAPSSPARAAAPAPAPIPQQPVYHAPQAYAPPVHAQPQSPHLPWNASSTPMGGAAAHPTPVVAPQLRYATAPTYAPVAAPVHHHAAPVAVAPAPLRSTPAANAMGNQTRPAAISWERLDAPADRTLLQRISPVHMGVLMVMVVIAMVVSAGPAAMNAKPGRLPALTASGGGDVPSPARAGAVALAANAPAGSAAAAPKTAKPAAAKARAPRAAGPRMIKVGSARLNARVRSGGIPSPAASANLAIAGGGRVAAADTGSVRMGGIPSAAASEQLGPQTLPFRPTDGVTLPRSGGERDNYAVDTHYGNDTLPMEEPALPAMTPGAAAARSEHQVQINALSGGSIPAPVAGGLAIAH